jgi:hypothetical protein
MRKKGKLDNKEYLIFRVYVHRTKDKEICDMLSSMPYALRATLVKEALRSYPSNKDATREIAPTQKLVTKNKSVMDRFSETMDGMEYSVGICQHN